MQKYRLEFILSTYNATLEAIKSSLMEFGDNLEILAVQDENPGEASNFKIGIRTDEPTVIFDVCAQFGRIKSAKINEIK